MSGLIDVTTGLSQGTGLQFQTLIGSAGLNAYVKPSGGGLGTISVTVSPTVATLTATGGTISASVSPTVATLTPSTGTISVAVSPTVATLTGS